METVSQEEAVRRFSELAADWMPTDSLSVRRLLDDLSSFYTDCRIEGASLDDDGDMLLLEWGTNWPLKNEGFVDLRKLSDDAEVPFEDNELKWVGLKRQVFAASGDDDVEFDDAAIGMQVSLFFGPANGDEPSSNIWVNNPSELQSRTKEFLDNIFVAGVMDAAPVRLNVSVDYVG